MVDAVTIGALKRISFPEFNYQSYNLTAASAGTQAAATPILSAIARFTTVGGNGYSGLLPPAKGGRVVTVINAGANTLALFPYGTTDTIDAIAAQTAYSIPPLNVITFTCGTNGVWYSDAPVGQVFPMQAPLVAGATKTLTVANNNQTVLLGTAAGSVVTLPAATGSGVKFHFVVSTTTTSGAHKILAASSSDFLNGLAIGENAGTCKAFASAAATNHSIQMPFTGTQPSGGFIGDYFDFQDIAANLWQVNGMYQAGTTPTTPFSTATS